MEKKPTSISEHRNNSIVVQFGIWNHNKAVCSQSPLTLQQLLLNNRSTQFYKMRPNKLLFIMLEKSTSISEVTSKHFKKVVKMGLRVCSWEAIRFWFKYSLYVNAMVGSITSDPNFNKKKRFFYHQQLSTVACNTYTAFCVTLFGLLRFYTGET